MSTELIRKAVQEIRSRIVMHSRFKSAYDGILELLETASYAGDVCYSANVIAPPGCGKNALIHTILRAVPSNQQLGGDLISIRIEAEANASQGYFVRRLMKELGYPTTIRASTLHQQSSFIAQALKKRGVKLLFIDEFQHVTRGQRILSSAQSTEKMNFN